MVCARQFEETKYITYSLKILTFLSEDHILSFVIDTTVFNWHRPTYIYTKIPYFLEILLDYFSKRPSDAPLHTWSKLYVFPVGFDPHPFLIWGRVLLYLWSPKGGCCSISDYLSCSWYSSRTIFKGVNDCHLFLCNRNSGISFHAKNVRFCMSFTTFKSWDINRLVCFFLLPNTP